METLTFKVHLDIEDQPEKPKEGKVGKISNRITQHTQEVTPAKLAKMATAPHSRTWMPGIMNGGRKSDNWAHQQVVAIDIDRGLSLGQAIERLKSFDLSITFAYSTFSSSEKNDRYRMVIVLQEVISEEQKFRRLSNALKYLFPEMDKQCMTLSHMFYGGREIIFENHSYSADPEKLIEAGELYFVGTAENPRTKQRRLKKLSENPNSINNIIEKGKNDKIEVVKTFDWDWARDHVRVFREFADGEWLYHPQIFGLATNLLYVEGGLKWMKEVMDDTGKYTPNNYAVLPYVRKMKYKPMRLANYSPFEEDHRYKNLLSAGSLRGGEVLKIEEPEIKPREEMREELRKTVDGIMESVDTDIHVLKVPTGVGKTESMLDYNYITYACPTHDLKNELASRFRVPVSVTPNQVEFNSKDLTSRVNYLYLTGADKTVGRLLSRVAKNEDVGISYDYSDAELAARYLEIMRQVKESENTIITTHHSGRYVEKHPIIVFDEDPLSTINLPIETITVSDITRLQSRISDGTDKKTVTRILHAILDGTSNIIYPVPSCVFNDYTAIEDIVAVHKDFESPVLRFLNAKHFLIDSKDPDKVHFIRRYDFNSSKKIVILSATANEWVYKQLYGDRVRFYDLGFVKTRGKLIQDTTYTYSRQNLSKSEVLERATDLAGERLVLTFAQYQNKFANPVGNIYFGNCRGTNKLSGKDLVVVGTPHVNMSAYLLVAKEIGLDVTPEDFKPRMQRVSHNGMEFKFNTFENPALRNIQFYFIESELRQAVGRARLENHDGINVLVLSNYPLREAEFIEETWKRRIRNKKTKAA